MPKRILIECTPTYSTLMTTGIQRVVRNLVEQSVKSSEVEVQAVILSEESLFALPDDTFTSKPLKQADSISKSKWSLNLQTFAHSRWVIQLKDSLRVHFFGLFNLLKKSYLKTVLKRKLQSQLGQLIAFQPSAGDVLVMVDANWSRDEIWPLLQVYRQSGIKIVFVLYDLIPIRHSEFCGESRREEFQQFIMKMLRNADGVLAISQTVRNDLIDYVAEKKIINTNGFPKLDYFYLGVDFRKYKSITCENISLIKQVFNSSAAVFLMVSTVEPRKNHAFLLDVFERLWSTGSNAKWVIAGRIGWMMNDFVERVKKHPRYNKNLFMFNDLDDSDLIYCYKHATALVSPTLVEGFGLPIIEALHYRLPVIASDIDVHREIGQEKIMYAKTNDALAWLESLSGIEQEGVAKKFIPEYFEWMNWQQSADQFLRKVLEVLR